MVRNDRNRAPVLSFLAVDRALLPGTWRGAREEGTVDGSESAARKQSASPIDGIEAGIGFDVPYAAPGRAPSTPGSCCSSSPPPRSGEPAVEITSLYPAFTLLSAVLVLREHVHRVQALGSLRRTATVVCVSAG